MRLEPAKAILDRISADRQSKPISRCEAVLSPLTLRR
jgi:hypothetical protein